MFVTPWRLRRTGWAGACWFGLVAALSSVIAPGAAPAAEKEQAERPPAVRSLAFSPDSRLLAAAAGEQLARGVLIVWDVEAGKPRWVYREPVGFASVAFSPDGRLLALGRFAPEVAILDAASGKLARKLKGHSDHARCVTFTPDGKKLVSGSYDRTIKIWDVATWQVDTTLEGHAQPVYCVAVSADGRLLASADARADAARLWDVDSGRQLHVFEDFESLVPHVAFSPDGRHLAVATWGGYLALFETSSYRLWLRFRRMGGVHCSSFSPDQRWLAVASVLPHVPVFDIRTQADEETRARIGTLLAQLDDDSYQLREQATEALANIGMAAAKQLRQAMKSESAEVRWRARRLFRRLGQLESAIQLRGHQEEVECVCFSPDGRLLASGDEVGQVRIWRVGTWTEVGEFPVGKEDAD